MKAITATELKNILAEHKLWLETKGKQGQRANLARANLACANLKGAILYRANLEGANLYRANLAYANLSYAILENANLENANLSYAILENANLENANLEGANLEGAILTGADLEGANLEGAILTGADLEGANLTNTVLDEKKKQETKMNMENENGFILSSEEKEMVLEYRKKTGKDKKINEIRATSAALHNSFIAIKQIAGGGMYTVEVNPQANTKLLQEILSLFGTVNLQLHSTHSGDGQLQKQTLSFAMPSLD